MEVKLNIDSSNIGETVVDLFKNLTPEKKEEIALQVMTKWLNEPYDTERIAYVGEAKRKALQKVLNSSYSYDKERYGTMEKIEDSSQFHDEMRNFKSSKEQMIEAVVKEAVDVYRKNTAKMIETDPQIQAMMQGVMEEVKKDFPKFVHDAMMYWFAQNMSSTMTAASAAIAQSNQTSEIVKEISQRVLGY